MAHVSKSALSLRVRSHFFHTRRRSTPALFALVALTLLGGAALSGCDGSASVNSTSGGQNNNSAAGSSSVTATFSNAAGTSADQSAFQSTVGQALTNSNVSGFTLLNVTGTRVSGTTSRSFQISLAENGPIQAGKTYTFSSTGINSVSTLTYTEGGLGGAPTWIASGGSAIIDSITGKNYKFHLVNVTFISGEDNNSGATGSFTVNGTVDATVP